jgi:hypothetical protein
VVLLFSSSSSSSSFFFFFFFFGFLKMKEFMYRRTVSGQSLYMGGAIELP